MTFTILRVLNLRFGVYDRYVEQLAESSLLWGRGQGQAEPTGLKLAQSVYQGEICQFTVKGDRYNSQG